MTLIDIGPIPSGGHSAGATAPRLTERHVLALGLGMSAGFVLLAIASAVVAVVDGGSTWAALHLAMAGAATVAIGTFMPHFAVTLAGTRPSGSAWRLAVLGLLAAGSALVVLGVTVGAGDSIGLLGTALVLTGLGGVAAHTLAPLREPLARRHPVVSATYGLALVELAAGVVVGGLGAAGASVVLGAWGTLRPAHAWLTLFGAISLTILATLVYLAPTVMGARIRAGWSLATAVIGMALGPLIVVAGFVAESRPVVIVGMALAVIGGVGQVAYVIDSWRRRGPFTSEHDWRSVAIGHLVAGTAWFVAATVAALAGIVGGLALVGWSIGLLVLPLTAGWMLQELVGSWTHLAPSVTPGSPALHARQRRVMASAARTRLVAWNGGLAAAWAGAGIGLPLLAALGGAVVALTVVASVLLLVRSLALRESQAP